MIGLRVSRPTFSLYNRMQRLAGKTSIQSPPRNPSRSGCAVGGAFKAKSTGAILIAHIPVGVLSQVYESFRHRPTLEPA